MLITLETFMDLRCACLLGDLDPRREYSPTWSIQNIQVTFNKFKNIEIYGGVKTY
jgi:hypothetical protein